MFKSDIIKLEYANLIGWRQHHDIAEIELTPGIQVSTSGEFFQQKHPALRLDYIQATLPDNQDLEQYLLEKVSDGSVEIFNDLIQYRHLKEYGKTLLSKKQLLNKYGWLNDKIVNENRFVGYQIRLHTSTGLQAVIDEIGLQFSAVESFKLYLFHSSKQDPIAEIDVVTTGNGQWDWSRASNELNAFELENHNEGVYLLGYYQDDLVGNAINNTNFDWDKGVCGSCNNSNYTTWRAITEHFNVYPFYIPQGDYTKGQVPDLNNVIYNKSESYGLNLRLSVVCDLTDFFITNKMAFKNLLSLKVVQMILKDMSFSMETNYIEERIKQLIILDLQGDVETKGKNLPKQYDDELKAVTYNISNINEKCLPCESDGYAPIYGSV